MPNWVSNQISIMGNIKPVVDFFQEKLMAKGGTLDNYEDNLHFSDLMGYPEIFKKWDTTNHPKSQRLNDISEEFAISQNCDEYFFKYSEEQKKESNPKLTTAQKKAFRDGWNAICDAQLEQYGVVGWYDFNLKYFGCKWDEKIEGLMISDQCVSFTLSTPWSPPVGFYKFLQDKFKDCDIEILTREESDSFMGFYLTERNDDGDVKLVWTEAEYGVNTDEEFFAPFEDAEDW